ncbi:LysR family transcriptional regulator [Xanthomarina sp. F2636L]|uniref:LysR family transcriptional regulator n=1 Tax=Xanthomarina sp. F2636L TaxID=2996018 RepID=UPI00225DEF70|nr:LysR family transcriptional regulator [Xanthomarina sp. F2636L]MCX7550675.1 LysR family transcriptional regulator [Xanthomarina sp. F2636L]
MRYKLNIFIKVAQHLSFTLASKDLNLSQPAVSKTIAKLEEDYNTTFFNRSRNSISLTNDGKIFLDYAYKITKLFEELEHSFLFHEDHENLEFHLGLSTTIATYVMPRVLAKIQQNAPNITFHITSSNTKEIEQKILDQKLEYGIVEGKSSNQLLKYTKFINDEVVLVTSAHNPNSKNSVTKKELSQLPFVSRELGSGTRDIIEDILKTHQVQKLNHVITLNSTEAIEQYLEHSNTYALLSVHAITEKLIQNKLKIVDIKNISFERDFYFVCRTGYQSQKMDLLNKLIKTNYNF